MNVTEKDSQHKQSCNTDFAIILERYFYETCIMYRKISFLIFYMLNKYTWNYGSTTEIFTVAINWWMKNILAPQ